MSYSLQDFLLYSAETWWVLYQEFTTGHWMMAAVIGFLLLCLGVYKSRKYQMFKTVLSLTNLALLVSSAVFYLSFYLQINQFAFYLAALCFLQLGLTIFNHWRSRQVKWGKTSRVLFLNSESTLTLWLFVITISCFAVSPGFLQNEVNISVWQLLLPGWSPLVNGLLLIFFSRFYLRLSLLWQLPIILVVIIEILTFYAMGMEFWWLAFFALVTASSGKTN